MQAIIKRAETRDWTGARTDVFALSEGQRPTSADLVDLQVRRTKRTP